MTRCGKSCSRFSNVTDESVRTVLVNSAGAWPAGTAAYTSRPSRLQQPHLLEIDHRISLRRTASAVRPPPNIIPPLGRVQCSSTTPVPAALSQHPASHASRPTRSTVPWAASGSGLPPVSATRQRTAATAVGSLRPRLLQRMARAERAVGGSQGGRPRRPGPHPAGAMLEGLHRGRGRTMKVNSLAQASADRRATAPPPRCRRGP